MLLSLIGLVLLVVAARPVWEWARTRDWVATPATLVSVSLESEQNRERTLRWQKVVARYTYTFDGVQLTGTRVLLNDGQLDLRSRRTFKELQAAKREGGPIVCYVNPRAPGEAVLDRRLCFEQSLVWLAVSGVFFGGALVVRGNQAKWRGGVDSGLEARCPDEPWRWNPEWVTGQLRSEGRRHLGETVGGGLILGGFTGALASVAIFQRASTPLSIALAVLGAILVLYAVLAGRTLARRARFGESIFRLAGPTGVVGGRLVGEVDAPRQLLDAEQIKLRLYCVVTRIVKSRDSSNSERDHVAWEHEQPVAPRREANGAVVPVNLVVPSSAPPTAWEENRLATWRLTVSAKLPGPDYHASFIVPVFETPESQPDVTVEKPPAPTHAIEEEFEDTTPLNKRLAAEGILMEPLAGGVRYRAPAGRSRRYAMSTTLWAFGWNGVLGGVAYVFWPDNWVVALFMIVVAALAWVLWAIGLIFAIAAMDGWLHSEELTIEGDRWRTRIGWWGLPKWRTEFLAGNIRRIVVQHNRGSSSRLGNEPEKRSPGTSDLHAQIAGANLPRMLLRRIKSRQTAEMLAEALRERLGERVGVETAEGFAEAKAKLRGEAE